MGINIEGSAEHGIVKMKPGVARSINELLQKNVDADSEDRDRETSPNLTPAGILAYVAAPDVPEFNRLRAHHALVDYLDGNGASLDEADLIPHRVTWIEFGAGEASGETTRRRARSVLTLLNFLPMSLTPRLELEAGEQPPLRSDIATILRLRDYWRSRLDNPLGPSHQKQNAREALQFLAEQLIQQPIASS